MISRALLLGAIWACALVSSSCGQPKAAPPVGPPLAAGPVDLSIEQRNVTFTDYRFRDGEILPSLRLHYSTMGKPMRDAGGKIVNAVLMLHWTSASGAALQTPEFVESLYGGGKPLDVSKHYLVFVDNVGHGRSSKPSDGLHARFPKYGYRDMVDLQHELVTKTLGIERLEAIVGLSMGGMHGWMWAETYPEAVARVMPVVSLPIKIAGRNLIWRRIVSRSIRSDPDWKNGDYESQPRGWTEGFALFRMMLDGVPHLQAIAPDKAAADSFIDGAVGQAKTLDANDVLYSLESSEDYDPEGELARIRAKFFVLNFSDDEFNPIALGTLERLMPKVKGARFAVQAGSDSSFGHSTQGHPKLWAHQVSELFR